MKNLTMGKYKDHFFRLIACSGLLLGLGMTSGLDSSLHAIAHEINQTKDMNPSDTSLQNQILIAQQSTQLELASVTLQGCNRSGNTVKCHLLLVSKKDTQYDIRCNESTRVFDSSGNIYICTKVQVGGRDTYWTNLLRGIPVKVVLTFTDIPSQVDKFLALDVSTRDKRNAQFRDINISR